MLNYRSKKIWGAAEEFQKRLNRTIKDIDQLVWSKARPVFAELTMHFLNEA